MGFVISFWTICWLEWNNISIHSCKYHCMAIRRIFAVFTDVAIFKSIKRHLNSFCSRSNCLSPFMGEFWSEEWIKMPFCALNINICNNKKIRLTAIRWSSRPSHFNIFGFEILFRGFDVCVNIRYNRINERKHGKRRDINGGLDILSKS